MLKVWVCGFAFVMAAGLAQSAETGQRERDLPVSSAQIAKMEIKVEMVKPTADQVAALLPGTIVPALNARIVAAAPFAGTVTQLHVLPGQSIAKGAVLATISSRDLLEASSALAQAQAELQAAEATAHRKRYLADKNIQNPTMADEAEAQVAKIKAVIEQHRRTLALGDITDADTGTYTIKSPVDGRVVETAVMPGDKIETMAPAVVVDMSDELWVEAQLPAQLVAHVAVGDRVRITDGPEGKIVSVGGSLDKMTRSAKLIASVPANSRFLPGQLVSVSIVQQAAAGALSVPASAVARINDVESVFVRNEKGFTLTPVEVAGRSTASATIHGNIAHDAQVAASGIPQLEQMLQAD